MSYIAENFNEFQKDALKEIANICAGSAASALSQLANKKVEINVPEAVLLPIEDVPKIVGEDKLVVGLAVRILGDIPSVILIIFSQEDALKLSFFLSREDKREHDVITDLDRSVLKEMGVILVNAYLSALSAFVGLSLIPMVPELIEDMAAALVDYILIQLSDVSRFALLIKSDFKEPTAQLRGNFFLLPNPNGLEIILKAIEGMQNG